MLHAQSRHAVWSHSTLCVDCVVRVLGVLLLIVVLGCCAGDHMEVDDYDGCGAGGSGAGEENQDDGDVDMGASASASASEGGTGAGAGAGKHGVKYVTASGRVISEERWRALFGSDSSSSDSDSDGCIVGDGSSSSSSDEETNKAIQKDIEDHLGTTEDGSADDE